MNCKYVKAFFDYCVLLFKTLPNSYISHSQLEHKGKQENGCSSLLGNDTSLFKNLPGRKTLTS